MRSLVNYTMFVVLFGFGILFGTMAATPGKSESHAILEKHGVYDSEGTSYFVYLPSKTDLSTEEFEALAVISTLYNKVQIVYLD